MAKRRTWWGNPALRQVIALTGERGWWLSGSQLDLDFANDRAFNRSTGFNGSPNSILTYTSPSPKMVYGDDGVLGYAPHNLVLQSDNLLATWTSSLATISSAELFLETANSGQHRVQQAFTARVGAEYGVKIKLKGEGRDWARIALVGTAALIAFFNLTGSGSVGTLSAGIAASITGPDSDGFFTCTMTGAVADNASSSVYVNGASADGVTTYLGDTAKGVRVKNAHVYFAPNHSNAYIPTTTAAVYSLPIDHNPTTFAPLGVLIEEQRTNLLTYSEQFDNAAWTKSQTTVTANAAVAPDGTTTADKIVENTATGGHSAYLSVSLTSGTVYTFSVYLKKGERTYAAVQLYDSVTRYGVFNLDAGTQGSSSNITSSSIVDIGGGWYRCSITFTGSFTGTCYPYVFLLASDTYAGYTGDGASGLYVWGAQLEAGAFPTSYIPTVASQVTRARDDISILTSAFGYNASEGSLVTEADTNQMSGSVYSYVASFGDGTANERMVSRSLNTTFNFAVVDGGVTQASNNLSPVALSTMYKAAFAYKQNDFAVTLDGGVVGTDVSGTVPTVTTLKLGADSAAGATLNGHIKRLTYFPTRKTNAELQALSA